MPKQFDNESFRVLFNATADGILVVDHRGDILIMNPAAERLFGYEEHELISQNVSLLIPAADQTKTEGYIIDYLNTRIPETLGTTDEITAQKKNGDCFPIHFSVGRVDKSGEPRFIGVIRDLSDQKLKTKQLLQREKDIRQLREKLVKVERMTALGEMSASLAHDINQPLTVIASYAQACKQLVQSGRAKPEELIDALKKIDSQAHRASQVINSIRYFSKRSSAEVSEQSSQKLIQEVIALVEDYVHDNGMSIELDLADIPDAEQVIAEPFQIQQVLLSLINNAVESMIETSETQQGSEMGKTIIVRTRMQNAALEISVIDQGCGIGNDQKEQIFNTFYTTKEGGLGVGLAICQSIITSRGGQITFSTNQKTGSTFSFTLPLRAGDVQ